MIENIAKQLKAKLKIRQPKIAIILGSGLSHIADTLTSPLIIEYAKIKGFPQTSVEGHIGRFVSGKIGNTEVLCMQGRIHLYEGHEPKVINDIIKALQKIGIETLVVTNAAGSLHKKMAPGSIMLIKDHINFSGKNPLIFPSYDEFGCKFIDTSNAYDKQHRKQIKKIAKQQHIKLYEGVYLMVLGPNFETSAEIKAFKKLGADAVGMSTVPEVISAIHAKMKVIGLSLITNYGTGLCKQSHSHQDVLLSAQRAGQNLGKLIQQYIKEL